MKCGICHRGEVKHRWSLCIACKRSYDRTAHREGSVIEAMLWAAKRARRMRRRRRDVVKPGLARTHRNMRNTGYP